MNEFDHCESFKALSLEMHYDVLDANDMEAMQLHLQSCSACREHMKYLAVELQEAFATSPLSSSNLCEKVFLRTTQRRSIPPTSWLKVAAILALSTCAVTVLTNGLFSWKGNRKHTPAPNLPFSVVFAPRDDGPAIPRMDKPQIELNPIVIETDTASHTPETFINRQVDEGESQDANPLAEPELWIAAMTPNLSGTPDSALAFNQIQSPSIELSVSSRERSGTVPSPSDLLKKFPASAMTDHSDQLDWRDCPWSKEHQLLYIQRDLSKLRQGEVARIHVDDKLYSSYRQLISHVDSETKVWSVLLELEPKESKSKHTLSSYMGEEPFDSSIASAGSNFRWSTVVTAMGLYLQDPSFRKQFPLEKIRLMATDAHHANPAPAKLKLIKAIDHFKEKLKD